MPSSPVPIHLSCIHPAVVEPPFVAEVADLNLVEHGGARAALYEVPCDVPRPNYLPIAVEGVSFVAGKARLIFNLVVEDDNHALNAESFKDCDELGAKDGVTNKGSAWNADGGEAGLPDSGGFELRFRKNNGVEKGGAVVEVFEAGFDEEGAVNFAPAMLVIILVSPGDAALVRADGSYFSVGVAVGDEDGVCRSPFHVALGVLLSRDAPPGKLVVGGQATG